MTSLSLCSLICVTPYLGEDLLVGWLIIQGLLSVFPDLATSLNTRKEYVGEEKLREDRIVEVEVFGARGRMASSHARVMLYAHSCTSTLPFSFTRNKMQTAHQAHEAFALAEACETLVCHFL